MREKVASMNQRTSPGMMWTIRKGFWNWLAKFKYRGNKPAHFPVPVDDPQRIGTVPLSSVTPAIPINNIMVADRVPSDESQPLKKLFYGFQLLMYRLLPAMQPGLPQVDADPFAAL